MPLGRNTNVRHLAEGSGERLLGLGEVSGLQPAQLGPDDQQLGGAEDQEQDQEYYCRENFARLQDGLGECPLL